jgi:hypothetical protein
MWNITAILIGAVVLILIAEILWELLPRILYNFSTLGFLRFHPEGMME